MTLRTDIERAVFEQNMNVDPKARAAMRSERRCKRLHSAIWERAEVMGETDESIADRMALESLDILVHEWAKEDVMADRIVKRWYRRHEPNEPPEDPEEAPVTDPGTPDSGQDAETPENGPEKIQSPLNQDCEIGSHPLSDSGSSQPRSKKNYSDTNNLFENEYPDEDSDDPEGAEDEADNGSPEEGDWIPPDWWWDLIDLMDAGVDVALVGPAGSGKTDGAIRAARYRGREYTITTAPQMGYDLTGYPDGLGRYVKSPFTDAMTGGKVGIVDEADRMQPDAGIAMNAPVANRTIYIHGQGQLDAAEGFSVVMTMNTWGFGEDEEYNSARQLDESTRNRLFFLEVDYDPRVDELLADGDGKLLEFAHNWRASVAKNHVTHAIFAYRQISMLRKVSRMPRFGAVRALQGGLIKGLPKETLDTIMADMPDDGNPWMEALRICRERMP